MSSYDRRVVEAATETLAQLLIRDPHPLHREEQEALVELGQDPRSPEERAADCLARAAAYGRAWSWVAAGTQLQWAYRELGAYQPLTPRQAGQMWHSGTHPIQVASRRKAEDVARG